MVDRLLSVHPVPGVQTYLQVLVPCTMTIKPVVNTAFQFAVKIGTHFSVEENCGHIAAFCIFCELYLQVTDGGYEIC